MKNKRVLSSTRLLALLSLMTFGTVMWAVTGIQVGPSGMTYASAEVQCAVNPITGMAPMVQAGLYNPKKSANAAISLNGVAAATVSFLSPDAILWLPNGLNTVDVSLNKKATDIYQFDASLSYPGQPNICIPDTSGNSVNVASDLETAASGKSSVTLMPGCALNAATGRSQPYVHLFDNGTYLLNVSVNNVPLTQLGPSRPQTPVFLSAGLNVISAAHGSLSIDYYVRDGGGGSCTLTSP